MNDKQQKLVVIDGKSVFYRAFYAMPPLTTKDGTPTGGIHGFMRIVLSVINQYQPTHVVVAWDKSKTATRSRKEIYEDYKADRKPMPEEMRAQIPALRQVVEACGWPLLELDDYEADDIMGALAKQAKASGVKTLLVSSDRDLLQLADVNTTIVLSKNGVSKTKEFTPQDVEEKYGLTTEQFIDYKALQGDSSDNIPGVKGVGKKTAKKLLAKFDGIDDIYDHLDQVESDSVRSKLEQDEEMARLSKELVTIKCDIDLDFEMEDAHISQAKPQEITDIFKELQFKSLLEDLPEFMQAKPQANLFEGGSRSTPKALDSVTVNMITTQTECEDYNLPDADTLLIQTLTKEDAETKLPKLKALIISGEDESATCFQVGEQLSAKQVINKLKPLLADTEVEKVGYQLKRAIKVGLNHGVEMAGTGLDILVTAFLLNPLISQQKLEQLAFNEIGRELAPIESANFSEGYVAKLTQVCWELVETYREQLEARGELHKLAMDVEWPTAPILAKMEHAGIKLDQEILEEMGQELSQEIAAIEEHVFDLCEQEFNLNSPQQLQEVLFEELELPTEDIRRTKTGYSTAASELKKLQGQHPVVDLVLDYRKLAKLQSTYVETLGEYRDKNGRIHTSWHQTVAQTGRLSSDNPNLQNIPIRSEQGKKIRRAFVPEAGNIFVAADYSQFELRIAAHLSEDEAMIKSFQEGEDIHRQTAAELYGIEPEAVSDKQRDSAKVVNFGVLYGMSAHGLSQRTGMDHETAQEFIDRYFEVRPDLVEYMDQLKEQAARDGYVETLFGRRRPMPDIHSSNWRVRNAAQRAAINMPIQGTESDLMKMAMIKVDEELNSLFPAVSSVASGEGRERSASGVEGSNQSKSSDGEKGSMLAKPQMLLQIHDSILLECPQAEAERIQNLLKTLMESIYELKVPLIVETKTGQNWGEL